MTGIVAAPVGGVKGQLENMRTCQLTIVGMADLGIANAARWFFECFFSLPWSFQLECNYGMVHSHCLTQLASRRFVNIYMPQK